MKIKGLKAATQVGSWPKRHLMGTLLPFLSLPPAAVCQILPKGVVAVLGPSSSPASSSIISNICGEKEVSTGLGGGGYLQAGACVWAPKVSGFGRAGRAHQDWVGPGVVAHDCKPSGSGG